MKKKSLTDTTDYSSVDWREEEKPLSFGKGDNIYSMGVMDEDAKSIYIVQQTYTGSPDGYPLEKSIILDIADSGKFLEAILDLMPKTDFNMALARRFAARPFAERRQRCAKAFTKWTEEDDALLTTLWGEEAKFSEMCEALARTDYAITKRLQKLQLI